MKISPHAIIDPKAEISPDAEIGPFCVIGPNVTIGAGTCLISHVAIMGPTTIGQGNLISPQVVLGGAPQDRKYKDAPTSRQAVMSSLGDFPEGRIAMHAERVSKGRCAKPINASQFAASGMSSRTRSSR